MQLRGENVKGNIQRMHLIEMNEGHWKKKEERMQPTGIKDSHAAEFTRKLAP